MTKIQIQNKIKNILGNQIKWGCFFSQNQRTLSEKYVYPCEDMRLRESLLGEKGVIQIEKYLVREDVEFMEEHKKLEELIKNGSFNPYKPYILSNYFIKSKTFEELDIIFTFKEKPTLKQNIAHIGEKGSGKTALQNYWLDKNNKHLEEQNIFWVRCNGHKLYRLWLQHKDYLDKKRKQANNEKEQKNTSIQVERLVSIEDYLDIQLVYVFAKYWLSQERPFLQKMVDKLQKQDPVFEYPISRRVLSHTKKESLITKINELSTIINKEEKDKEANYSYAYNQVMRISLDSLQLEKRRWIAISKALQLFLKQNGYWILKIVDGVDNVHINDKSSARYYEQMIDEAYKFIKLTPESNHIHFMAMRERTFMDVQRNPVLQQDTNAFSKIFEINHEIADFKQIFLKRFEYAQNNLFCGHMKRYQEIADAVISSIGSNVNSLHHNNVRSFLYNKMSLIHQVYYRIKQLYPENENIDMPVVRTHIKNLTMRNRFLNGRLFLSTRKQWGDLNNEFGLCCMNIFYFDIEKYPCNNIAEWWGICKTRILQLLSIYEKVNEQQLVNFLCESLKYPKKLINDSIRDLRAFGMIDSKFDSETGQAICYVLSEKGKKHLERSFGDINTIYYFALDAPLPLNFINNELLAAHNNKFHRRTQYPYTCISTVISFILFLLCVNKEEERKYLSGKNDYYQKYKLEFTNLRCPFQTNTELYKKLLKTSDELIASADSKDIESLIAYLDRLPNVARK